MQLYQPLISQFYDFYTETAISIGDRIQAGPTINYLKLDTAHSSWMSTIVESLEQHQASSSEQSFWIFTLSTLARTLCSADCITYSVDEGLPSGEGPILKKIRPVILKYPNEYTGLEFVRQIHLQIYFSFKESRPSSLLPQVNPEQLNDLLCRIRLDHDLALNYVDLLNLPRG